MSFWELSQCSPLAMQVVGIARELRALASVHASPCAVTAQGGARRLPWSMGILSASSRSWTTGSCIGVSAWRRGAVLVFRVVRVFFVHLASVNLSYVEALVAWRPRGDGNVAPRLLPWPLGTPFVLSLCSLCSDSSWSSRPQPVGSRPDAAPCEVTREEHGLSF